MNFDKPKDQPGAAANPDEAVDTAAAPGDRDGRSRRGSPKTRTRKRIRSEKSKDGLIEKVVFVNRVSKVVQGGKNFSFSALIVVGDGKGRVGFGIGKAREVQDAIQKGINQAKNRMTSISMAGTTIPHEALVRFSAAKVLLRPASPGTGVIAGASVRAVCECAGIKDILTKSLGSQTPQNVVRATLLALQGMLVSDPYSS